MLDSKGFLMILGQTALTIIYLAIQSLVQRRVRNGNCVYQNSQSIKYTYPLYSQMNVGRERDEFYLWWEMNIVIDSEVKIKILL